MKNLRLALAIAAVIAAGAAANAHAQSANSAGTTPPPSSTQVSNIPSSAFFVGLGASYNSTNFTNQSIYAQGVSSITQNGIPIANGSAAGTTDPGFSIQASFAPAAQVGYFQHFGNTDWLWGAKFSYNYVGATSTSDNLAVPQSGSFASSDSNTFTGNVVIHSYQTSINNQMMLTPFIGRSFGNSFFYVGAGPTLSHLEANLNGVIGFADINGSHVNITGAPSDFSNSQWVFGGAVIVGATYFFDPSWFLDASYTYATTVNKTSNYSGPFSSSTDGFDDTGILSGTYSGNTAIQSVTLTINKAF